MCWLDALRTAGTRRCPPGLVTRTIRSGTRRGSGTAAHVRPRQRPVSRATGALCARGLAMRMTFVRMLRRDGHRIEAPSVTGPALVLLV